MGQVDGYRFASAGAVLRRLGVARTAGVSVATAIVLMLAPGVRLGAEPSTTPRLDWLFDGLVNATTRIGNTLYVAGSFTTAAPSSGALSSFFQLSPTTGAALPGLPAVNGSVRAIAPDGAGGYYIVGTFTNIGSAGPGYNGGLSLMRTAHVRADGSVDAAFQPQFGGTCLGWCGSGHPWSSSAGCSSTAARQRGRFSQLIP